MTGVTGAAVLAVLGVAWGFHAVADHHVHLRLLKLARPAVVVPVTRHDSWWHALPRRRRAVADAAMIACAALFGVAWTVQPEVTAVFAVLAAMSLVLVLAVRARHPGRAGGN